MTTFGSNATYSCDPGYELLPDNSVRSCQPDGLWSGRDPLCERMNYAYTASNDAILLAIVD